MPRAFAKLPKSDYVSSNCGVLLALSSNYNVLVLYQYTQTHSTIHRAERQDKWNQLSVKALTAEFINPPTTHRI